MYDFEYNSDDFDDLWDTIMYYRWGLNAIFIGLPFLITVFWTNTWNLVFNIKFNNWWAYGNLYLMVNTLFALV